MPTRAQDLAAVRAPVDRARGLPNAYYTDPDLFAHEARQAVFDGWAGLAVGADVPEPGDGVPLDFFGLPLLLLRGRDGQIRVFENVCRHRGMILLDAPRRIDGAIRCPYHSWCYSTDGRLISTPHVGGPGQNAHPAIDRTQLGLTEIRSHVWRDVVWINVAGTAPPFAKSMADVIDRWADIAADPVHGGPDSRFELTVQANWKLAVENYCESYHLPWVHPGLNSYSRLEDHYHIAQSDRFAGQGTQVYRQLTGPDGARFPDFTGRSERWDTAAEYLAIFPNVLMGVHRDHSFAILLMPDGAQKTVEKVHLYYASAQTDPTLRDANCAQWKDVFEEDIFVVEGMQKGRRAPGFDGGRFSPAMDGPTHVFHAWVAGRLQGPASG